MLAVFPQFIRPDGWPVWLQALLLGALLLAIATPIYSGLALAATHMGRGLIAKPGAMVWLNRMAGVAPLLLGASLAAAHLSSPVTGAGLSLTQGCPVASPLLPRFVQPPPSRYPQRVRSRNLTQTQ